MRPLTTLRRVLRFAAVASLAAAPAWAQRALGVGDDASTLPAGRVRWSMGALWDRANERYDADGKLRALGVPAMTWNGSYDARLASAGTLAQTLSGLASFDPSLGLLRIARRDASADGVLGAEFGVLPRLTIGVSAQVASHGIEPYVVLNPARTEGTMGLNPGWRSSTVHDANALIVRQLDSAVAQTTRRISQCVVTPTGTGCAPIIANLSAAQTLVANASNFASALVALYGGRANGAGQPFVPVAGTLAQRSIDQRLLAYRDQFVALGNAAIGAQSLVGASLFSPADLGTLLTDSLYGYRLRPLRTVHAYGLGNVSVSAKARVFETVGPDTAAIRGFAVRQAFGVTARLSGGDAPAANEPYAPTTGSGSTGIALQSFTDLFYRDRYSATIVVGYGKDAAQSYAMRIAAADSPASGGVRFPLQLASREVTVARTPSALLQISVTPRVALTSNLWLGAGWSYAAQGSDAWSAADASASGGPSAADVAYWAAGTEWKEQRFVLGGTYSTVAAAKAGRAKRAFDVSYQHEQTVAGSGTRTAHLSRDVVTLRWYARLWGKR